MIVSRVNGIQVEHGDQELRELFVERGYGFRVRCPRLHLFDCGGQCP